MTGATDCQIDANGCATDGAGNHGNNEACTVRVPQAGTLTATEFSTESGYDIVAILHGIGTWNSYDVQYSGEVGPRNVNVAAGSMVVWRSDTSTVGAGWTICWAPYAQAPSLAPQYEPICAPVSTSPTPPPTNLECPPSKSGRRCHPSSFVPPGPVWAVRPQTLPWATGHGGLQQRKRMLTSPHAFR